jgi:hypothetical protein
VKKIFLTLKKNWQIIILILGVLLSVVFFRRRDADFTTKLRSIQLDHDQQIKKISESLEKERRLRELNEAKYQEIIASIQLQYESAKKELTEKKKKQIETIVSHHGNDPAELAIQLSKVTGFDIIMPEE